MSKTKLVALPDIVFESPIMYDKVWQRVVSEFKVWNITSRRAVPYMESVLRKEMFEIECWDGKPFVLPEHLEQMFDPDSEFASVRRYTRAAADAPNTPKQRSKNHHRSRLLALMADALKHLRERNLFL